MRYLPLLLLTGCSTLQPGLDRLADVNDQAVKGAEFTLCYGASIGAIRRRFGTEEEANVWKMLCKEDQEFTLITN